MVLFQQVYRIATSYAPYFKLSRNTNTIELCITSDISVNPSSAFTLSNPNGINIVMSPKLYYFFLVFLLSIMEQLE